MPTNNSWNSPNCKFSAYKSANTLNISGTGTIYSYICDTELFDVGSNYDAGTGIFTAPRTGSYFFNTEIYIGGCTIATEIRIFLVSTGKTYYNKSEKKPASSNPFWDKMARIIRMTAGDTCYCQLASFGEAADTNDLYGGTPASRLDTVFSGFYVGP